jgi:hypothetical protein
MPYDLDFLNKDIKRQQEIAQQALDEAKRLDKLLKSPEVPEALRSELEESKASFLRVARELAANATTTSSSAITIFSSLAK